MASLQVFYSNFTPKYAGTPFYVKVGYYADDGSLTNVTASSNLTVTQLSGPAPCSVFNPPGAIIPVIVGTYALTFSYNDGTEVLETEFIFLAIENLELTLTSDEIYKLIKQEEPPNVYTQVADASSFVYLDNQGVATVVEEVYASLASELDAYFPETTPVGSAYVPEWEQAVTGQYNMFSPTSSFTPLVLQFLRNLNVSLNPYDLAYAITQYIYLRLGVQIFVYVQEFTFPLNQGYWVLNESALDETTVLAPGIAPEDIKRLVIHIFDALSQIPSVVKQEIQFLIYKIIRANTKWSVDYSSTPATYYLIDAIGPTYKGDPRSRGVYCLQYDPNAPENVDGLTNPYLPYKLESIAISPSSGTFELNTNISFDLIGTYQDGFTLDITNLAQWASTTPLILAPTSIKNVFEAIAVGSGQIKATYAGLITYANITIDLNPDDWILNTSLLGTNTTLA